MLPVDAPTGTETVTAVVLQLVGVAFAPANDTVLAPWVAPKFTPEIVTSEPTTPELGLTLVMLALGSTVKLAPLLAVPPTVTVTRLLPRAAQSDRLRRHSNSSASLQYR